MSARQPTTTQTKIGISPITLTYKAGHPDMPHQTTLQMPDLIYEVTLKQITEVALY